MLSAWAGAAPSVAAALLALLLPGLAVAWAAGLRGTALWGLATPLSVSVVALSAVVAPWLGLRWGPVPVLLGTVAALPAALLVRRLAGGVGPREPRGVRVAAAVAAGVGSAAGALAVARGIGDPDRWPQTFDAVFHLNAVHRALETGTVSSLGVGSLAAPDRPSAFYPAAWHGLAALVAEVTGVGAVVAASAVAVAVAVLWPLGCLLLVRVAVGPSLPALVAAGVLAAGAGAAPFLLLSYGTLWPNALGTLLLPGALALAAAAAGVARRDPVGARRAWLLGLAVLPGLALAHPNVVVTAGLAAVLLVGAALEHRRRAGRLGGWRLSAAAAGWVALAAAAVWALGWSPAFAAQRATDWRARESLAQAAGEALLLAPQRLPVPALLAALAVTGLVVALRDPLLRWLAVCHLAACLLFVLAAGSDAPLGEALTGAWYNDAFRLGALLPVTGVPLAAVAVERGWALLTQTRPRLRLAAASGPWRGDVRPYAAVAAAVVAAAVLTQGFSVRENARVVGAWYRGTGLVGVEEQALLDRLAREVPEGTVVAGNPWNGSALTGALGDRAALFPHLNGAWGSDRTLLATSLADAADDPRVCEAAARLRVGYVLTGPSGFWTGDRRQRRYPGLEVAGRPGFEQVDSGGRLSLHRLVACRATAG
ncbi:MAG TPA: DUF6541 family protein [Pedococcus sp.]